MTATCPRCHTPGHITPTLEMIEAGVCQTVCHYCKTAFIFQVFVRAGAAKIVEE